MEKKTKVASAMKNCTIPMASEMLPVGLPEADECRRWAPALMIEHADEEQQTLGQVLRA